jgi:hypothetical protein
MARTAFRSVMAQAHLNDKMTTQHPYLTPFAKKTEGIAGQPRAQLYFHRPLHVLLQSCFDVGFVVDRLEEPPLPQPEERKPGVRLFSLE